jgi:hypothetical protein
MKKKTKEEVVGRRMKMKGAQDTVVNKGGMKMKKKQVAGRRKKMNGDQDTIVNKGGEMKARMRKKKTVDYQDITNIVKTKGKKKDTQDATGLMKKMKMMMKMKMNPAEEVSKREAKGKERMVWKKLSAVQRFVKTSLALDVQISTTHVPVASALSTV